MNGTAELGVAGELRDRGEAIPSGHEEVVAASEDGSMTNEEDKPYG